MIFINPYKAHDNIPRDLIWFISDKRSVLRDYINILKDTYERAVTSIRTIGGEPGEFPITIGLHQGVNFKSSSLCTDYG